MDLWERQRVINRKHSDTKIEKCLVGSSHTEQMHRETWLKSEEFYQDTLGQDFEDVWTMPSAERVTCSCIKRTERIHDSTLSLDMDPAVISVSLDQQQAILISRGSLKLTTQGWCKNGASRDAKGMGRSDPAAVHVTDDGTVAVHKDAAAGTYTVTAVSQFGESKQADSGLLR